jgi:hypothetical protein
MSLRASAHNFESHARALETAGATRKVNPRPAQGIRSLKAARSVNQRWTNLLLYGNNGDTGTRPWKVKENKQIKSQIHFLILFTNCVKNKETSES